MCDRDDKFLQHAKSRAAQACGGLTGQRAAYASQGAAGPVAVLVAFDQDFGGGQMADSTTRTKFLYQGTNEQFKGGYSGSQTHGRDGFPFM